MEFYTLVLESLCDLPVVQTWPQMRSILKRAVAKKPRDWRLPAIACEAVGGSPECAVPAGAAIACAQISIILIDDMLDADPRGEHLRVGAPFAANLAAAFQAAMLEAVSRADAAYDGPAKLAAIQHLNQMMLVTAFGQYLDAQNPTDEASYWRVVETKSAPFFGAALFCGAVLGGASIDSAAALDRFGRLYGEMIQIHDDLNDAMAVPANPDWILGRSPLPILFAQTVEHPDRTRFAALRQAVSDPDALAEAQAILIRCGAFSYGVHQLLLRYQQAQQLVAGMPVCDRTGLETLLEEQVEPVRALFAAMGAAQPDLVNGLVLAGTA